MAEDTRTRKRTKRPGLAILASLVLVPASAIAAVALVSSGVDATQPEEAESRVTLVAAVESSPVTRQDIHIQDPVTASADDLEAACTIDAASLVDAELNKSITSLQMAALDALREICAKEGLELPGPPAPPPVVRTVTVSAAAPPTSSEPPEDDSEEKEHEEKEHEEKEHEEKEHDDDD